MGNFQITISGDSPDLLRENVQAWLDSHEDGAGTRFDRAKVESYQTASKGATLANVGDSVRANDPAPPVLKRPLIVEHVDAFGVTVSSAGARWIVAHGEYSIVMRVPQCESMHMRLFGDKTNIWC